MTPVLRGLSTPFAGPFVIACLAAWIGTVIVLVGSDRTLGVYDEGIVLTGAMRLLDGQWPHRDFYANYGPGQFSVIALLFSVFGEQAWPTRIFDAFVKSLNALFVLWLVAATGRRWLAWLAWAMVVLVQVLTDYAGYPVYSALAASLGAAVLLQRSLLRGAAVSGGTILLAGIGVGVAGLFRYDIGFFGWAAGICTHLLLAFAPAGLSPDRAGRWRTLLPAMAWWSLGALIPILPLLAAYAAVGALPGFIHDVVVYPSTLYPKMRSLPFPGIAALLAERPLGLVYMPVIVASAAILLRVSAIPGTRATGEPPSGKAGPEMSTWITVAVLLPIVLFFYLKGYVRVSVIHMVLAIVPAIALLAILPLRPFRSHPFSLLLAAVAALTLIQPLEIVATKLKRGADDYRHLLADWRRDGVGVTPPVGSCRVPPSALDLRCLRFEPNRWQAAAYVRSHTSPADRLFVGTTRHDKIYANDVAIYFAAGRLPATRWHHFDPGLQSTEPVQRTMVDELSASRPPLIVLISDWDNADEPNDSARSSGVVLLDDWLRARYREVARFGSVAVLRRDD